MVKLESRHQMSLKTKIIHFILILNNCLKKTLFQKIRLKIDFLMDISITMQLLMKLKMSFNHLKLAQY